MPSRIKRRRRELKSERLELRKLRKAANRAKREALKRERLIKAKRELRLVSERLAKAKTQLGDSGGRGVARGIGRAIRTVRKVRNDIKKAHKSIFGD